jgi:hypothetical protein
MIICMVLEACGVGPAGTFFLDLHGAGSLWILTREVVGDFAKEYEQRWSECPSRFCASAVLAFFLGLTDVWPPNLCCVRQPLSPRFPLCFIDSDPAELNDQPAVDNWSDLERKMKRSGVVPCPRPKCECPDPVQLRLGEAISLDFGTPLAVTIAPFHVSAGDGPSRDPVDVTFANPIQVEIPSGLSVEFSRGISVTLQGRIRLHSAEVVPPILSDLIRSFFVALFPAVIHRALPALLEQAIPSLLKCAIPLFFAKSIQPDDIETKLRTQVPAVYNGVVDRILAEQIQQELDKAIIDIVADIPDTRRKSRKPVSVTVADHIGVDLTRPASVIITNCSATCAAPNVKNLAGEIATVLERAVSALLAHAIPRLVQSVVERVLPSAIPVLLKRRSHFSRTDIREAVKTILKKIKRLPSRPLPLAVYPTVTLNPSPPTPGPFPLIDLLDDDKRKQLFGDTPVKLHEFISNIETQIWEIFFGCPVPDFGDRTVGALFGFTEIDQLWTREEFDKAVATVVKLEGDSKPKKFQSFFNAVWTTVEDSRPEKSRVSVPTWKDENPTARYAIALMKWFLISLEERIASVRKLTKQ